MTLEEKKYTLSSNEEVTRNILSIPDNKTSNTYWDKLVEKTEKIELKTQEDLKKLKEQSLPDSVHRAVQNVKKLYAYLPYTFNADSGVYDGMEVEWDKNTGKIQSIVLSVKIGNRTLHFQVNPEGSYDILRAPSDIYRNGDMIRIGGYEYNTTKGIIRLWTKDWIEENPDAGLEKIHKPLPLQKMQSGGNMPKKKTGKVKKQGENIEEIASIQELIERYRDIGIMDALKTFQEKKDILSSGTTHAFSGRDSSHIQYALMRHKESPFGTIHDSPSADGKYRLIYLYKEQLNALGKLSVLSGIIVRDDNTIMKRLSEDTGSTSQKFVAPFHPVTLTK